MNKTKTAMITVCGRPNVGKSSLTNALVGEKIAIVSNKPQTTRNRIYGVVNRGDTQYVLLDTPGFHKARNCLGDYMVKVTRESIADVDAVLLLVARHPGKTVLLASHGCAIRNLLCWAHGWPIERLNDVNWGENTCVSVLEVDESGTPRLLLENDASHLPADCATLGKQDWWRPEYRHDPFGR